MCGLLSMSYFVRVTVVILCYNKKIFAIVLVGLGPLRLFVIHHQVAAKPRAEINERKVSIKDRGLIIIIIII